MYIYIYIYVSMYIASLGMGPRGLVLFSRTDASGESKRGMMMMMMMMTLMMRTLMMRRTGECERFERGGVQG